jgi:hypothetical protein
MSALVGSARLSLAAALRRIGCGIACLTLACAGTSATEPTGTPPTSEELALLAQAEARGREMYELDHAAWVATDALFEKIPAAADERTAGWIVVPRDDARLVRFLVPEGDAFASHYDVLVGASSAEVTAHAPPAELAPEELAMARALVLAIGSMKRRCSERYHTAVVRDAAQNEWRVYLMPATSEPDTVVLAGFDVARVSADGSKLIEFLPLSRSCMMQRNDPNAEGYFITHVLHPLPIETHVFTSLSYGRPVYVVTETALWKVEGGRIEWVEDNPQPEAGDAAP